MSLQGNILNILEKFRQLAPVTSGCEVRPAINQLIAAPGVRPAAWQLASQKPYSTANRIRPAVESSEDLKRILALPTRPPFEEGSTRAEALIELMTSRLARPERKCQCREKYHRPCIKRLRFAQAWTLYEAPFVQGVLGSVAVGAGKSALDILTPMVMPDCKLAVLLVPPGLVGQLLTEYELCSEHFNVPSLVYENKGYVVPGRPVLRVVPYSRFCRAGCTTLLEQLKPDLIIADECHRIRHPSTATTSRVLRYFADHEETRLCVWSGTLTGKSIRDYAHLSAIALREGSPLPLDPNVVEEWSLAIDPIEWQAPIGALEELCKPGEHIYQAFNRRLAYTRGVVSTTSGSCDASLVMHKREPPSMSPKLEEMLKVLRDKDAPGGWTRPDGEELVDLLSVNACARQLAQGFFYRWVFPRLEAPDLIEEWFAARKEWHKELRQKLFDRREHLDSPLLCARAAMRFYQAEPPPLGAGTSYEGDLPVWQAETWPRWLAVRDKVYHEVEAVWVDEYLAKDAADWARTHRGIVWYEYEAFGRRVAELSGFPLHGGGPDAEEKIRAEKGDRSIIASVHAHGTGRDGLQYLYSDQLIVASQNGAMTEQLLGRLHRVGQQADEVKSEFYRNTRELRDAFDSACEQASYIQETLGAQQKLVLATKTWERVVG